MRREYAFDRAEVWVGRSPLNDLTVSAQGVSARHGALRRKGGRLWFEDQDSLGGTVLERGGRAERQRGERALEVGDALVLGGSARLVILEEAEGAGGAPSGLATASWWRAWGEDEGPPLLGAALAGLALEMAAAPSAEGFLRGVGPLLGDVVGEAPRALGLLRATEGAARVMMRTLAGEASVQTMGLGSKEREAFLARCAEGGASLWSSPQGWWLALSASGERRPVCLLAGLGRVREPEALLERVASWARPLGALLRGLGREADRAEELAAAQAENRYFRERQRRRYLYKALVVESAAMRALYERLGALVERDEPVCITGEAGTGKEMIVRALHHLSPRSGGLLVTQRCGEMAPELMDVELFGVCEGEGGCAQVGEGARPSLFELARGGTLFLQEVERLSPSMQLKLLRVMKEGEFRRLGEECARPAQVRLVLGTRKGLKELVAAGALRAELYVALKERELAVPPLRERAEDVMVLAKTFGQLYARRHGLAAPRLGQDVEAALRAWSWPGNVRELMGVMEQAVLRGGGKAELGAADLIGLGGAGKLGGEGG